MAAERGVVLAPQRELDGRHQGRGRDVADELSGMRVTSTIRVMPPPGQTYTGAPPQVTRVSACLTERVRRTGFSVTPARRDPPAPAMNMTVVSAGSQFSAIRSTTLPISAGMGAGTGFKLSSSTNQAASSPVVDTISRRRPGQAILGLIFSTISSGSVISVAPQPSPGSATWK